jgi:hypothetical protein
VGAHVRQPAAPTEGHPHQDPAIRLDGHREAEASRTYDFSVAVKGRVWGATSISRGMLFLNSVFALFSLALPCL